MREKKFSRIFLLQNGAALPQSALLTALVKGVSREVRCKSRQFF
jgi:hypothetical protein